MQHACQNIEKVRTNAQQAPSNSGNTEKVKNCPNVMGNKPAEHIWKASIRHSEHGKFIQTMGDPAISQDRPVENNRPPSRSNTLRLYWNMRTRIFRFGQLSNNWPSKRVRPIKKGFKLFSRNIVYFIGFLRCGMVPDTPGIICYRFWKSRWPLKLHNHQQHEHLCFPKSEIEGN